jgi:hypothetical protein
MLNFLVAFATDDVVIDSNYFGLSSAASYPYNLGRTVMKWVTG